LWVSPTGCQQYVDGAWISRDTKVYQNGTWNAFWDGRLYTPGDEWSFITGGWTGTGMKPNSGTSTTTNAPIITRETGYIYAEHTGANCGTLHTVNAIDISDYSTIIFEGDFKRAGTSEVNLIAGIWESPLPTYYSTNAVAKQTSSASTFTRIELNVVGITGKYIVGLGMTANGTYAKIENAYMI
jgi:hypothetical protein